MLISNNDTARPTMNDINTNNDTARPTMNDITTNNDTARNTMNDINANNNNARPTMTCTTRCLVKVKYLTSKLLFLMSSGKFSR